MTTLADIAQKTGLSVATVSHILNKRPGYRPETRERVLAVADRLGYRPHFLGKALVSGRTSTISIVTPSLDTPIQVMIVHRMAQLVRQHGYMAYIVPFSEAHLTAPVVTDVLSRCVDGLILYQTVPVPEPMVQLLRRQRTPYVFVDSVPADSPGVAMDRSTGFEQAIAHLAELGHRGACFLGTPHDEAFPDRRLKPYQRFCRQHGLAFSYDTTLTGNVGEAARLWARAALSEPDPPTAWLCGNDELALGAITGIRSMGRDVPGDISIVGFNDLPFAQAIWPALTTIHQPREELPTAAIDMLFEMIADRPPTELQRRLECGLVVRESTGPPRCRPSGTQQRSVDSPSHV